MKENAIEYRLKEYLKILEEDIRDISPKGIARNRDNAIITSVLKEVKKDVEEILQGMVVKRV